MIIKDVMTKDPFYVTPETSITEAKALMNKKNISKLPVLDRAGLLVGIITKNDLAKAGPSDATSLDMFEIGYLLSKLTVEKFMTKKVVSVSENEVVEEAARLMVDGQIGCVPVIKNNLLVGIVTESDLFHLFTDMFGTRYSGVRAVLSLDDKPGQLAKLIDKIASQNGNIVSVVTKDTVEQEKTSQRKVTIKATDISMEKIESILKDLSIIPDDLRVL